VPSLIKRVYLFLSNNILLNNLLIICRLDHKLQLAGRQWKAFSYNKTKSAQENSGFSHREPVQHAIDRLKTQLSTFANENMKPGASVLDIGCGPGIYLSLLQKNFRLHGIDISEAMIREAKKELGNADFYQGNFLDHPFSETFDLIYSISALEYVPVSKLDHFFRKCNGLLNENGCLFVQYPHALSRRDLWYPDRNYISYSPAKIDEYASRYFTILKHDQFLDGRPVTNFDRQPYPTNDKDFRNGYLLIARKKQDIS